MSNINNILSSLHKVKSLGGGRYSAICPVHDENTPSLSLKDLDDGRVLIHCFGCGANGVDLIESLGLDLADLFPDKPKGGDGQDGWRKQYKPFPAAQVLKAIAHEARIVQLGAEHVGELGEVDKERVALAANRINEAVSYGE